MSDVFHVTIRKANGSRAARQARRDGITPGVLYGHGQESVSLAIPSIEVETAIRTGNKLINLDGDVTGEIALIKDVQWDPMGMEVLHVDLNRVRADERVQTQVSIELVGEAPGIKVGGVVKHMLHRIEIDCPVVSIPDKIVVRVNSLQLDGQILVSELELTEGVKLITPADTVVVQCDMAVEEEDEDAALSDLAAEPEVIGRKAEDGEEGE